jgi:hypothetical protein
VAAIHALRVQNTGACSLQLIVANGTWQRQRLATPAWSSSAAVAGVGRVGAQARGM